MIEPVHTHVQASARHAPGRQEWREKEHPGETPEERDARLAVNTKMRFHRTFNRDLDLKIWLQNCKSTHHPSIVHSPSPMSCSGPTCPPAVLEKAKGRRYSFLD